MSMTTTVQMIMMITTMTAIFDYSEVLLLDHDDDAYDYDDYPETVLSMVMVMVMGHDDCEGGRVHVSYSSLPCVLFHSPPSYTLLCAMRPTSERILRSSAAE